MIPKADFYAKEVQPPHGNWCHSGHVAPETFHREGEGREATPTKFFQVSCTLASNVNGVYCEPCLVIANAISRKEVGVRTP